jgi:subtilisin-like proprotein convertase family protein
MKTLNKRVSLVVLLTLLSGSAHAALTPLAIPDGDINGVSDTFNVASAYTQINSLRVILNISAPGGDGFNGDLYLTLAHDTGYSVLLNRVGRRSGSAFGYGDSGFFDVIFDDAAPNGDVHAYRTKATGSQTTPLAGPLTGTYQPDGRAVDPDAVLDTSPRTAMLSSFLGLAPNGDWTLFVADVSSGGVSRLENWSLEINGEIFTAIPEPSTFLAGALLLVPMLGLLRRRNNR